MGVITIAFNTKDPEVAETDIPIDDIDQTSLVVGMSAATTDGTTRGTGFQFGAKSAHELRKKLIRRNFWNI